MSRDVMKLALEALENSIDLVSHEARNAEELYGKYPSRLARIQGLVAFEVAHEKAITALREALAEQPERPYRQLQDNGSKYFGESWDKAEQPAQRTWVGLTPEELDEMFSKTLKGKKLVNWVAQAIEAKLRSKNNG